MIKYNKYIKKYNFSNEKNLFSGKTMKAVVLEEVGNLDMKVYNIPIPQPKKGEVLVKLKASGVCKTDLAVMMGKVPFPTPAVMGHEVVGEIAQLGEGVDRFALGDRVVGSFIMPCADCHYCDQGKDDLCENFFKYNRGAGQLYDGTSRLILNDKPLAMYSMGGLAEYCVIPTTGVAKLPKSLPYDNSCIIGCAIFTAYGALKNAADMKTAESIAVIGSGGIGSNVIQLAKVFGGDKVIAVDIGKEKLELMKGLGATHTVDAATENVEEKIKEYTEGRGVDIAIEALGHPETFRQAVHSVKDGGRAVMIGIAATDVLAPVSITHLVRRQIKIVGSYGARTRKDLPDIVKLAERGYIDLETPVTAEYSLETAHQAYKDLENGKINGRAIVKIS